MEKEEVEVTNEKRGWRGFFESYADDYVREGISLIKRIRLAITLVAFAWLAFLIVLAVLLILALAR